MSDNLKLLASYSLKVKEPSGLSLSLDKKSLWTVSDEGGRVYQVSLEGEILRQFKTGLKDLEGIAVLDDSSLAVVSERTLQLRTFGMDGERRSEGVIDLAKGGNNGPEALDYDPKEERYFVMKEKSPGMLIVLDKEMQELSRTEIHFAEDYSSIAHEPVRDHLWLLSDQSGNVHVVDHQLNVMAEFSESVPQAEGIAVDYENRRMYLVSDKEERLYVFEFDDY